MASLARLSIDSHTNHKMTVELSSILHYINKLDNLNLAETTPTSQAVRPRGNVLRADLVVPGLPRDSALKAAPAAAAGFFKVPRVVEDPGA